MLKAISWQSYLLFIAILFICWYLIVVARFYFRDLYHTFLRTGLSGLNNSTEPPVEDADQVTKETSYGDLFELGLKLKEEAQAILETAVEKGYQREETLMALQLKAKERMALKDTAFQFAINHFIELKCRELCYLPITKEELNQMWVQ